MLWKGAMFLIVVAGRAGFGQEYSIDGVISDRIRGTVLPGVQVRILQSAKGSVTDSMGHYRITGVSEGKHVVAFEHIGYQKIQRQITISSDRQLDVQLEERVFVLDVVEISPGIIEIGSEISTKSLSSDEVLATPNFGKDVFRSLQVIPSIASTDWSSRLHVRGGNPDETAFLLDNMVLHDPYHLDELDGPFGVVNTEIIKDIAVVPGGHSARYPDRMSGTIRVRTKDEVQEKNIYGAIDFLNASVYMNKAIHPALTHFVSARRGYIDVVAGGNSSFRPVYYDVWNKFAYRSGPRGTASLNLLYSSDDVRYEEGLAYTRSESFKSQRRNIYGWFNWNWNPSDRLAVSSTFGWQNLVKNSNFAFESSEGPDNKDNRNIHIFTVREDLLWKWTDHHTLGVGMEWNQFFSQYGYEEVRFDQLATTESAVVLDTVLVDSKLDGHTMAIYAEDTWRATEEIGLQFGVRLSRQTYSSEPQLAPRLGLRYGVNEQLAFKLAYGWYFQPDSYYRLRVYDNQSVPDKRPEKSIHYAASIQYDQAHRRSVTADLYVKEYVRLRDDYAFDFGNRIAGLGVVDGAFGTKTGSSYGMEVSIRQLHGEKNHLNVVYAFGVNRIANGVDRTVRDRDRTHAVTVNHILYIGKSVTLGAIWRFHSGDPYTPVRAMVLGDSTLPNSRIYFEAGEKNSRRLPSFQTLDLKIEKAWEIRSMNLVTYLNLFNILGHRNVRQKVWKVSRQGNRVTELYLSDQTFFPRLLSLGLSVQI